MGLLIDLLKAAGSAHSLLGGVGRWMQAVSSVLDSSNINGPPRYGQAIRLGALVGWGPVINQIAVLSNTESIANGIAYEGGTGIFTVPAGRYLLHASAGFTTFSDPNAGYVQLVWANADDLALTYGTIGKYAPLTSASAECLNPNTDAIVEFTEETRVALLVGGLSGAGLTMNLPGGSLDINITELR
jgi:hypothetical protein